MELNRELTMLGTFTLFKFPIFLQGTLYKMKVIFYLKCYKVLAELCLFITNLEQMMQKFLFCSYHN